LFDRNEMKNRLTDGLFAADSAPELGTVICKECNEVLYTLPTDGVKTLYGLCRNAECRSSENR